MAPANAAAVLAFRLTKAQGFPEGNERTAITAGAMDPRHNGVDGRRNLDSSDRVLADLLVQPASGKDLKDEIVDFFVDRAESN
jgi:prophage maintenance system killer protein